MVLWAFVFLPFTLSSQSYGLVIHGGAGNSITEERLGERAAAYNRALSEAVAYGYTLLEDGADAVMVVTEVIKKLEDNPLFNAGKGAVSNADGDIFHDASIMRGSDMNAGAVASIFGPKNPITVAEAVMKHTPHVLLSGEGAESFASSRAIYFLNENERADYLNAVPNRKTSDKKGTVGCVVLDMNGDLAAGTSTGGTSNKLPGRIGDSPIIGAGTWADNRSCAVSATGDGEYFIRTAAASYVGQIMRLMDADIHTALEMVIGDIGNLGGQGGLIAIDKNGTVSWEFNTKGMFRAAKTNAIPLRVELYKP